MLKRKSIGVKVRLGIAAMKRYLISVLVISALVSVFLLGCSGVSPSEPKTNDCEQRLAKLEKEVQGLSTDNILQPRVIEKDFEISTKGYAELPFYLKVGDRVEGEVSFTYSEFNAFGVVRDPYRNPVVETPDRVYGGFFPWRFAFIAATEGEYTVRLLKRGGLVSKKTLAEPGEPRVHMKIVVHMNN